MNIHKYFKIRTQSKGNNQKQIIKNYRFLINYLR